jgi:hypothetical protein
MSSIVSFLNISPHHAILSFLSFPPLSKKTAYSVYHTGQGTQGLQKKPSNQQLDTIFGTHKDVEVVEFILKNGKIQHGDIDSKGFFAPVMNSTRGNSIVDVRGKGLTGI